MYDFLSVYNKKELFDFMELISESPAIVFSKEAPIIHEAIIKNFMERNIDLFSAKEMAIFLTHLKKANIILNSTIANLIVNNTITFKRNIGVTLSYLLVYHFSKAKLPFSRIS